MHTDVQASLRTRDCFWLDWTMLAASFVTVGWVAFLR
jgi:hypothetical protein